MAIYQRLRDMREDADLTQRQFAEIIGISMNHYGKYERGETDIPLDKAITIAKYYNVSLDYLAGLTNVKTVLSPSRSCTTYIINLFEHLSTQNKERIEERMLEMLERQRNEK